LIRYHASWVLPVSSPPIRDGWILVDRGRIVAIGHRAAGDDGAREVDLGEAAVLPGLVNAHTHLELSYLRDQLPPASSFVSWTRRVADARRRQPDPNAPAIVDAIDRAIGEAIACGTAVVGDVSNTLTTFVRLTRSPMAAVVFYELIRFDATDARGFVERAWRQLDDLAQTDRVRASLAAHGPHSVAPLVFRAIRQAVDSDPFAPCSVHLCESAEEVEFIARGSGPWRGFLEELGAWDDRWVAPGVSPVRFLDESGFLDGRLLAVHGVQMTPADLARLVARGTTLVTCPRSNRHTGAGAPPVADFYRSGVRVAVGTDSLASAPDMNLFAEVAALRALAPDVPASTLLASATAEGARALGFDAAYGTVEPGKQARLIAVDLPASTSDVEEYLVTGIHPDQVKWIER
jgi:cytosine/adenosine deaminase-related metal-dependent hydrolase